MAGLCLIALTGCAFDRVETAKKAQQQMVGLSKDTVLACMGRPVQQSTAGQNEVWSYPSGGDPGAPGFDPGQSNLIDPAAQMGNATSRAVITEGVTPPLGCMVNVVFQGDRVQRVDYTGRTGGMLSRGEQCAYAVRNCTR
jgi:hypothetical protein